MLARFSGASLGLLAFSVAVVSGLWVQNPITVTLSRSILAMFLFFVVGLVIGRIASAVVAEHENTKRDDISGQCREKMEEIEASHKGQAEAGQGGPATENQPVGETA